MSQWVQIDDELKIHYEVAGDGEQTILLLPGWTMSTRVFSRQLDHFAASQTFRFITFDPRAHGLSSKTETGHDYRQHGRDLHAFIEKLKLRDILLGGWSFGCLATLAYLDQFGSERLSGFIMLDGPPRAAAEDNQSDWASYRFDDADGFHAFFNDSKSGKNPSGDQEFASWMLENKSQANIQWLVEISRQTPAEVALQLNNSALMLDYRAVLKALDDKLPLWYLKRSEREKMVRAWARKNTPSAQLSAFGEHLMFWERAEQFNPELEKFAQYCATWSASR